MNIKESAQLAWYGLQYFVKDGLKALISVGKKVYENVSTVAFVIGNDMWKALVKGCTSIASYIMSLIGMTGAETAAATALTGYITDPKEVK